MKPRWRSKILRPYLEMLNTMQVLEDDEEYQNPVDSAV